MSDQAPPRAGGDGGAGVVLIDIDGTLLDSNDAHAESWQRVLREGGFEVDYERVRKEIGKGGDKLLPELTGLDAESTQGKELSKKRQRLFLEEYLPRLAPVPGARALLERLRAEGFRLVLATSASDDELKKLTDQAGVTDLVPLAASKDDAKGHSKPDPNVVLAALARGNASAEEALMLGDTPYDIEAARKAKVSTVAVRSGGWGDDDLAGAEAIYNDAADLLAHFAESPFGRRAGRRS